MENVLFEQWAEQWLEEKKSYVKASTYASYRTIVYNHLIPEFGIYRLEEIDHTFIQKTILKWSESGRRGGLAEKSIKDNIVVLKMSLKSAGIDERQISGSIGLNYPYCSKNKNDNFVLSEINYRLYIQAIQKSLSLETLGYILCLHTGMRIGEICALQWQDINMEEKIINVKKTIQRIYIKNKTEKSFTKIVITEPKSKKSKRVIPISNMIYGLLEKYVSKKNNYVITGTEKYMEPRLYRKHYETFIEDNTLHYIKFHGLRHTFATRCIEAGADYKTVSELLGHASVNLTLNLYVHPHIEEKRKCVNLL